MTAAGKKSVRIAARTRGLLGRFLGDWVWPRWRALIGALALTACLAAATGAYPMIIKLSFDTLMKGDSGVLLTVLVAIVVITCVRSFFLYLQTVATNRIVMGLSNDLQKKVFAHLVAADFARLTRDAPGQLVSRLTNDIGYVQVAGTAALNTAVRDTLSICALLASMIWLDWLMSLIVLVVYPIAALPVASISQRLRKVAKRTQSELGDMTSLLTEQLSSPRLIKTYGLEGYAVGRVDRSFDDVLDLKLKAVKARARLDPMLEALGGIAVAGVIGFAYWRIASGISTVGDFMGFVSALLMAAQPIRGLGNLSSRVNEGLAAVERFYEVLDEAPLIQDRPGARPLEVKTGQIRFEAVTFAYGPAMPAVRDLDLDVTGGTTVALVGRSGAGKSTVINLVPRLFDVGAGRILIDGQNVREVTLESLRRSIAIVSQDVTLLDDTIRANIALGRLGASTAEIERAAEAAAAHRFIIEQPQGYETRIGDGGTRLSGGQRQRIALARAILRDAPILLLDEATSALDSESERLVQDALAKFTRNRTTLVIAHRLATVRQADLICVLDGGTIIERGTHDELFGRGGLYADLCRHQLVETSPGEETTIR
ncbi:MAG: ABC transporter ATP-binding protein [Hyphomicrobiaceae bacterium]